MNARIEAVITRYVLTRLPLGDQSLCKLTAHERDSIVFYMAGETLEGIATCEPHVFVITWRRRINTWPVDNDRLKEINNFRFGLIARAVISYVKHELKQSAE